MCKLQVIKGGAFDYYLMVLQAGLLKGAIHVMPDRSHTVLRIAQHPSCIYGFTLYLIADVVQLSNTVYARDFCVFYVLAYLGYLIKPQAM